MEHRHGRITIKPPLRSGVPARRTPAMATVDGRRSMVIYVEQLLGIVTLACIEQLQSAETVKSILSS